MKSTTPSNVIPLRQAAPLRLEASDRLQRLRAGIICMHISDLLAEAAPKAYPSSLVSQLIALRARLEAYAP